MLQRMTESQLMKVAHSIAASYGIEMFDLDQLPNRKSQRAILSVFDDVVHAQIQRQTVFGMIITEQSFYNTSRVTKALWCIVDSYRRLGVAIDREAANNYMRIV